MNINRIFLLNSCRRLWFSSNHIRTIYVAQPESSPLQIYRNKIKAHEVCFYLTEKTINCFLIYLKF